MLAEITNGIDVFSHREGVSGMFLLTLSSVSVEDPEEEELESGKEEQISEER